MKKGNQLNTFYQKKGETGKGVESNGKLNMILRLLKQFGLTLKYFMILSRDIHLFDQDQWKVLVHNVLTKTKKGCMESLNYVMESLRRHRPKSSTRCKPRCKARKR